MKKVTFVIVSLVVSTQAFAWYNVEDNSVWKNVKYTEATKITSKDGTPLKARFYGQPEAAVAATPQPQPEPVAVVEEAPAVAVPEKSFVFTFDSNVKTPNQDSMAQVEEIKEYMKAGGYTSVKIVGFADKTGNPAYNQKLSLARAQEVKKLLQGKETKNIAMPIEGGGQRNDENLQQARVVELQFFR